MPPPIYLSIANLKGGTGKTTLAAWLGFMLSQRGYRVLLVDLDLQAHLTSLLVKGIAEEKVEGSVWDLLRSRKFNIRPIDNNLDLLFSTVWEWVAFYETMAQPDPRGYRNFHDISIRRSYDFVIFDCPPDPIHAKYGLMASEYVLIPTDGTHLSIRGTLLFIKKIFNLEASLRGRDAREALKLLGIVPVKVERGRLSKEDAEAIKRDLSRFLKENIHLAKYIYNPVLFENGLPRDKYMSNLEFTPKKSVLPIRRIFNRLRSVRRDALDRLAQEFLSRINNFRPYSSLDRWAGESGAGEKES